jgi:hypothetical protein
LNQKRLFYTKSGVFGLKYVRNHLKKRRKMEEFFKTNIDIMMVNRKIMMKATEREDMNAIDRKCYRELKYEMDPYEWKLVKLPNKKTKAMIVQECTKYKDWGIDEDYQELPKQIIDIRQTIIDSFEVINGFSKKMWDLCTFTKEQYIERRAKEEIIRRKERRKGESVFKIMPKEIIIPKIYLIKEDGKICWITQGGIYYADELLKGNYDKNIKKLVKEHIMAPRIAIHDNSDQIKYDMNNEIEWIFSSRYG